MTEAGQFCSELFESELTGVLQNCRYITLPFTISGIPQEINILLTQCGETFFMKDVSADDLQKCLIHSKIILNVAWEKLNTGHWKNVDENWHYVYTFASLFKVLCFSANKRSDKMEIIKACDMGLLMGAPLMKNILSRIASYVSTRMLFESKSRMENRVKKIKLNLEESSDIKVKYMLKEEADLSIQEFYTNYVENSEPVLLLGAIKQWPALSSRLWNLQYIWDKTSYRTVPIEIGSKYTDDNWTQKLMTIEKFIEKYILNKYKQKEIGYLAQHNLFNQIPELLEDISIPDYITENQNVDISVYFGPSGTVSPLHFDPKRNLLAQVMGEKYIRLYSKEETKYLYPRFNSWLSNTSEVDVENPDLENYPLFSQASYSECILKSGSLLYIPPGCWHFVRSLSTSLSISFWW